MYPIFNINKQIKSSTQKHNSDETAETHSDEPKSKKICNHEQHDEHIENIQLKKHDLNLYMQSVVDLGDINSGPKQPILQIYLTFPLTKFETQNRSFNAKNYSEYEWLEYSVSSNAVFCFNCVHFAKNLKTENLITTGYNNWRKLNEKLLKHSKTVQHLTSNVQYNSYKSSKLTGTIITQLSAAKKMNQYMKVLIKVTLFCGKQGLALRGHDEKSSTISNTVSKIIKIGNFRELYTLFAKNDKEFSEFFNRKINYTSWIIQNKIIPLEGLIPANKDVYNIDNIIKASLFI
ncbi:hypothetical protein AGLY_016831 [Aphis glycines]|uniref:TTF-type domain-containing protein n=1 Tax=Aphis glycines TaxID=307491 RepID=A0A6G0SWL9_APHGL|nr:hypothetical protein AGLY_016831 [Aphis glycines]